MIRGGGDEIDNRLEAGLTFLSTINDWSLRWRGGSRRSGGVGEVKQISRFNLFVHNNRLVVEVQGRIQVIRRVGEMKQTIRRFGLFVHNNRLVVEVQGRIQVIRGAGKMKETISRSDFLCTITDRPSRCRGGSRRSGACKG